MPARRPANPRCASPSTTPRPTWNVRSRRWTRRERDRQATMLAQTIEAIEPVDPSVLPELRAALARTLYHSLETGRMDRARTLATVNVSAARTLADRKSLVSALRALHDVSWSPGTAQQRLAILDELAHL